MLELILILLFLSLGFHVLKLLFRVTWGMTKLVALLLFVAAFPALAACVMLTGWMLLLIPLTLTLVAFFLLKVLL